MINNSTFTLTDEELITYNKWLKETATAMGEADIESWTVSVKFSFNNMGTRIVAYCESELDRKDELVIRDETDW